MLVVFRLSQVEKAKEPMLVCPSIPITRNKGTLPMVLLETFPQQGRMPYRVEIDVFRGPLDLLLYLVRKHEVEIIEIPVATIARQYLDYLEVLEDLNVNDVGDFLEVASTLIEIKSREVLPNAGEEVEEIADQRQDLVHQLLEYKRYRDAATALDDRGRDWQQRYTRQSNDLPARQRNLADEPIHELELWDLVSAFSRVIRDSATAQPSNIIYDDTPLHVYMERIYARITEAGRLAFSALFEKGMHKSTLIGLFLAILQLVRHHGVLFEQDSLFGEIALLPPADSSAPPSFAPIDDYEAHTSAA